jgi:hypothetical protein
MKTSIPKKFLSFREKNGGHGRNKSSDRGHKVRVNINILCIYSSCRYANSHGSPDPGPRRPFYHYSRPKPPNKPRKLRRRRRSRSEKMPWHVATLFIWDHIR